MPKLRSYKTGACQRVQDAIHHLRQARRLLVEGGAPRAAAKVRRAMKSTEGALRHADRLWFRCELPQIIRERG
mgnify:CR=1 FL=1